MVLTLGCAGAAVGYRLGLPAGVLTGALAGVGGGGIALGITPVPAPPGANAALQVMVGIMVGIRITRSALQSGLHALLPATLLSAAMILTSVLAALVAGSLTSMDLVTALFAAAPGGLTEMAVVSVAFGADGAAVAAVHLTRLLVALLAINAVLAYLLRPRRAAPADKPDAPGLAVRGGDLRRLATATACGVAGGGAGLWLGIPAGGVVGALAGSAAYRLTTTASVPVRQYGLGVQLLGGLVIGLGLSAGFFAGLVELAGAAAILIAVQMLLWAGAGYAFWRLLGYDRITATFSAAPGGMSEMISTSAQAGADVVTVAFTHLVRLSAIIVVVPALISILLN